MIREFFYLQKSDRKVILTLLLVIVIALGVFFIMGGENEEEVSQQDSLARTAYYDVAPRQVERFAFDPNTADSTQLLRLGLQSWQVRNIYKYRAAGGVYRKKEDFARLYGLTVKQYRELEPYIHISDDYLPASSLLKHERRGYRDGADTVRKRHASIPSEHRYQPKISAGETVVLNMADTTLLKTVPGIGPYFARKIVQYGERLGGYVSVDQLDEIEDFPLDAKNFLVVADPAPRKLNVNKLSLNELKRHPYINFYQARAITDYRRLHGSIHSLQDLRLSKDFPPEAITRLEPYVEY
ncbi:MAG: helix-hairpin-helix domain-containing protein [Prevotella sp.]|nr:helix-hairpin-helix domain-containing protein [Prevotella sp.]